MDMTGEHAGRGTVYLVRFERSHSADPLGVIHEATLQAQAEGVAREYAAGANDGSLRWRYEAGPTENSISLLVTSADRGVIAHFATEMSERYGQCVEVEIQPSERTPPDWKDPS